MCAIVFVLRRHVYSIDYWVRRNTDVITVVPRDSIFEKAEAAGKTVVELFPDSEVTKILLAAADRIMAAE